MKNEWQKFVNGVIRHGDKVKAYKDAYPKCKSDGGAKTNATKLLKNTIISDAIKLGAAKAESKGFDKAVEARSNEIAVTLLTAIEKRSILAKIARGEHRIIETTITRDGPVSYDREPNPYEIAKVIEIDNKMTGDNEPEKIEAVNRNINTEVTPDEAANIFEAIKARIT